MSTASRAARVAVTAFFCLSPAIRAGELPVAQFSAAVTPAKTLDESARSALAIALPLSEHYEHGGVLYECEGAFYFSPPVTSHERRSVSYRITMPIVCRLVGLYHTHSLTQQAQKFSADDIAAAKRFGVRSYLGIADDGSIRVYDPIRAWAERGAIRVLGEGATARGELLATRPAAETQGLAPQEPEGFLAKSIVVPEPKAD